MQLGSFINKSLTLLLNDFNNIILNTKQNQQHDNKKYY